MTQELFDTIKKATKLAEITDFLTGKTSADLSPMLAYVDSKENNALHVLFTNTDLSAIDKKAAITALLKAVDFADLKAALRVENIASLTPVEALLDGATDKGAELKDLIEACYTPQQKQAMLGAIPGTLKETTLLHKLIDQEGTDAITDAELLYAQAQNISKSSTKKTTVKALFNAQDEYDRTVLMHAVNAANTAFIRSILAEAKKDQGVLDSILGAKGFSGNSALHLAFQDNNESVVDAILEGIKDSPTDSLKASFEVEDNGGNSVLIKLISDSTLEVFTKFVTWASKEVLEALYSDATILHLIAESEDAVADKADVLFAKVTNEADRARLLEAKNSSDQSAYDLYVSNSVQNNLPDAVVQGYVSSKITALRNVAAASSDESELQGIKTQIDAIQIKAGATYAAGLEDQKANALSDIDVMIDAIGVGAQIAFIASQINATKEKSEAEGLKIALDAIIVDSSKTTLVTQKANASALVETRVVLFTTAETRSGELNGISTRAQSITKKNDLLLLEEELNSKKDLSAFSGIPADALIIQSLAARKNAAEDSVRVLGETFVTAESLLARVNDAKTAVSTCSTQNDCSKIQSGLPTTSEVDQYLRLEGFGSLSSDITAISDKVDRKIQAFIAEDLNIATKFADSTAKYLQNVKVATGIKILMDGVNTKNPSSKAAWKSSCAPSEKGCYFEEKFVTIDGVDFSSSQQLQTVRESIAAAGFSGLFGTKALGIVQNYRGLTYNDALGASFPKTTRAENLSNWNNSSTETAEARFTEIANLYAGDAVENLTKMTSVTPGKALGLHTLDLFCSSASTTDIEGKNGVKQDTTPEYELLCDNGHVKSGLELPSGLLGQVAPIDPAV